MDITNVMDGTTHRIQQSSTATNIIFLAGHRFDLLNVHTIMDHFAIIVEQHRADQRFSVFSLLFLDHGIEAANGVIL